MDFQPNTLSQKGFTTTPCHANSTPHLTSPYPNPHLYNALFFNPSFQHCNFHRFPPSTQLTIPFFYPDPPKMDNPSHFSLTIPNATTIFLLLLLAITIGCANSARTLEDVGPEPSVVPEPSDLPPADAPGSSPVTTAPPTAASSSGQIPATSPTVEADADAALTEAPGSNSSDVDDVAPAPATTTSANATSAGGASTTVAAAHHPQLSFFMHDILGGSHPSGRVVTGIIANSDANGVPFSKRNGGVLPVNGGVPLVNGNSPIVNNNNAPLLAGLSGVSSSSSNDNNNQAFVTAGKLPAGATLQQLMFGTMTAVDDELTEGHELGSAVVGRAQGFYLASSLDGTSQTMALTALFHGGEHEEGEDCSLSFFGIHRAGSPESQIAVVGGTGKYENAKGYANIETLHHEDQHTTDGVETILQFSVYLLD